MKNSIIIFLLFSMSFIACGDCEDCDDAYNTETFFVKNVKNEDITLVFFSIEPRPESINIKAGQKSIVRAFNGDPLNIGPLMAFNKYDSVQVFANNVVIRTFYKNVCSEVENPICEQNYITSLDEIKPNGKKRLEKIVEIK